MPVQRTPEQEAVVKNRGGGLLVSAAAGSGKTRVLVERLLDRILTEGKNVDEFLIITFTRAAAEELRGRIGQELAQALQHVKALAIMDKAESFSANGGPLFSEVRGALYDLEPRPRTVGYVYGLGGRDITPAHFHTVFARLQAIAAGGELGPVYTHLGQRG